jgi:8-oxo-dGTP pyrophosphatase MutT (NUDIX family)
MQGFSEDRGGDKGFYKHVVSAGGVIYKSVGDSFEVALVSRGRVWCLPKGIIEKGETAEETALREVKEETGLAGELIGKIGEISYNFFSGRRFFKTVHFYLFRYVGGSVEAHDSEVDSVKWFPISEALQALTYINEKKIVTKALEMLKKAGSI